MNDLVLVRVTILQLVVIGFLWGAMLTMLVGYWTRDAKTRHNQRGNHK
jgi:hypothetical protein